MILLWFYEITGLSPWASRVTTAAAERSWRASVSYFPAATTSSPRADGGDAGGGQSPKGAESVSILLNLPCEIYTFLTVSRNCFHFMTTSSLVGMVKEEGGCRRDKCRRMSASSISRGTILLFPI